MLRSLWSGIEVLTKIAIYMAIGGFILSGFKLEGLIVGFVIPCVITSFVIVVVWGGIKGLLNR